VCFRFISRFEKEVFMSISSKDKKTMTHELDADSNANAPKPWEGHTPTPWALGSWGDNIYSIQNGQWVEICRVHRDSLPVGQSRDAKDAAFIVEAANSYYRQNPENKGVNSAIDEKMIAEVLRKAPKKYSPLLEQFGEAGKDATYELARRGLVDIKNVAAVSGEGHKRPCPQWRRSAAHKSL
jgi:hypothetical protein